MSIHQQCFRVSVMRKRLLYGLTALLLAGNLQALSVDQEKQQQQQQQQQQADQLQVQKYQSKGSDNKKSAPSATTFTPTEKIGAGSAVSFPVDI
jgi:Tfp pilus assembly protein PilV